jgi:ubiquinone/menaquinone biosynthesis C-methylase UbiE
VKLDIGSGDARYKDFTTVDLYTEADIKADMGNLPISDNSVEEIWASHCLEHILPERVQPALKEWLRVMKPGAVAKIMVPDLDYACRAWLERKPASLTMIFGSLGIGQAHYHGWGAVELRQELLDAGFEVLSVQAIRETAYFNLGGTYWHDMVNLYAEAKKPTDRAQ